MADLEAELQAGFRKLLDGSGGDDGGVSVPSEQAILDMCERDECRGVLSWLAKAMQSGEVILAAEAEEGVAEELTALAEVLGTVSGDPTLLTLDELREEVEELEAREAAMAGPSGRIAQLVNRRDRLAALGPELAKSGGSMKGCERTTHQMCISACEDISAMCSELGHAVTDLSQVAGTLAELHEWEGKGASRAPPLLSQLSLENFIAQGDKHGEHVRRSLVLGRADEAEAGEEDVHFGGRLSAGLADEHALYSNELERLRKVFAWGKEEHINGSIALAQARATRRTAEAQLCRLEEGEKPGGSAAQLEAEVMGLQQETIAAERSWEDALATSVLPRVASLAAMHGVKALEMDVAASRARQEARMACQCRALRLLRLQSARLDVLELSMALEMADHRSTAAVAAAAEQQLRESAASRREMMRKVERIRSRAADGGSPERGQVLSADALVPLHVAVGGDEEGPSRAFLSATSLAEDARKLSGSVAKVKRGLEAIEREHAGVARLLELQIAAFEAVLWAKAGEGGPVCTPAALEEALGRLEEVKGRLDHAIEVAVQDRDSAQGGGGVRGRGLFVDFFLNPDNMSAALRKLKREAGVVS